MSAIAAPQSENVTASESVSKLVPGGESALAHLSNSELLARTRQLVGRSNQVFAALLLHLAEVEARGIHRARACASLYTYCIYELRFSEDAASRRASAARLVKRFPAVLDAIAAGELHLTGLLLLGPHLTDDNHREVLARAKFRTKKEIAKLVRALAPLPDVPDRIAPLRVLQKAPKNPTWAEFVESLCPPVRELRPGERPRDWANDTLDPVEDELPAPEPVDAPDTTSLSPSPSHLPPLSAPQLYQMQFSTSEEHVTLVERAKALLSRQSAGQNLGELHLQAMRLLVAALEKKRFAVGVKPRRPASTPKAKSTSLEEGSGACVAQHPRQRGRYIPAAQRRAVFERDSGRCTHVDDRGQRCRETHGLEIHHLHPFAKGGPHRLENLALRCAPHNTLAAEQDFGRAFVARKRDAGRHLSRRQASGRDEPP